MESERRRVLSQEKAKEYLTNSHEYVEIGGIKWATMNIGAETEVDYGLYFQWGDTAGYTSGQCGADTIAYKKPFYYSDYKFNGGRTNLKVTGMTKYNSIDGKTVLDPSDDAATLHWGGNWRMPTTEEFAALGAAVNTEYVTNYNSSGINGFIFTDKTDSSKKLFFPAAGSCGNGNVHGSNYLGIYWSNSLVTSDTSGAMVSAYTMFFDESGVYFQIDGNFRINGFPVRPVLDTSE